MVQIFKIVQTLDVCKQKHYHRLNELLNIHHPEITFGGQTDIDENFIAPTILDGTTFDSKLWKNEIFGPILPIITYDDFDEAIDLIRTKPKPLSLYLFSEDENSSERILNELSFLVVVQSMIP